MSTMSDGKTYIDATRHAAKVLIDGMNWETKEVRRLQDALEVVEEIGSMNSWIGFVGQEHPSEEDRAMIDQYLALQRETGRGDPRSIEIVLRKRLEVHEEARAVLAGALLQIGRQGISRVHEGLEECPNGKDLKGLPLKRVVWNARNQSMHWEECDWDSCKLGVKHKKSTFEKLGSESGYGPEFSPDGPNRCKNMAWLVVKDVLGWDALEPYETDMQQLIGQGGGSSPSGGGDAA